jgi:hypothetical protein
MPGSLLQLSAFAAEYFELTSIEQEKRSRSVFCCSFFLFEECPISPAR